MGSKVLSYFAYVTVLFRSASRLQESYSAQRCHWNRRLTMIQSSAATPSEPGSNDKRLTEEKMPGTHCLRMRTITGIRSKGHMVELGAHTNTMRFT